MTYSVKQICDRLGVNEHTVLAWINVTGELKAINVGVEPGKKKPRWRITAEALAEFEESRTKAPKVKPVKRRVRRAKSTTKDYFPEV